MFDENAENKAADPQKFFAFSFLVFEPAETECFLCMRGIIGQVYASLTVWRQNGDTKEGAKRKKRPQLLRVTTWQISDLFNYLVAGAGFEPATFRL